jgi:hypothetical protein
MVDAAGLRVDRRQRAAGRLGLQYPFLLLDIQGPAAAPLAVLGLLTTVSALVLVVITPQDEEAQARYVAQVVGMAAVLVGAGVAVYLLAKRRHDRTPAAL